MSVKNKFYFKLKAGNHNKYTIIYYHNTLNDRKKKIPYNQ